jgi:hypothetical protein
MNRPITTLILPISTDGKLLSGDAITTDPNPTWRNQSGIIGYLQPFFDFNSSESYTLTTGTVIAHSGINSKTTIPLPSPLKLVVLDYEHALTTSGITYLAGSVTKLIHLTAPAHPHKLLETLYRKHKVTELTLHSTPMNALWLEYGLIDYFTLLVYPLIVGASGTPVATLGLTSPRTLQLLESRIFDTHYICLRYRVNPTV